MSSSKLLLFIQSSNANLYVNIIMHCVLEAGVKEIFFAANRELPGRQTEVLKQIRAVRSKLDELALQQPVYQKALDLFPPIAQMEERIIRVSFVQPEESIPTIKKKFVELDNLIVDISGCNKRLSSDIISSFILAGLTHICCFELEDEVYSQEWRDSGRGLIYHDLKDKDGVVYYAYVDFSKPGTTIKSFDQMRLQGRAVRLLFMIVVVLGVAVAFLIQQEQNGYAQIATVIIISITALGFINDIFGIFDRLGE